MFEGLRDSSLTGLENLNLSGSNGIVSSDIRAKVYSRGDYCSENCEVHDWEELERDVRRAVYDLGVEEPDEWEETVMEELRAAARGEDDKVTGEDVSDALRYCRMEYEDF